MSESTTPFDPRIVPVPPRLHWGILLALQIVTIGLFQLVWLVVQAWWVKRMTGETRGLIWSIANLCSLFGFVLLVFVMGFVFALQGRDASAANQIAESLSRLIFVVLNLTAVFTLRSQMESYPINMSLSAPMTFFFGTIYFQYHMNHYVLPDANEVFGELPSAPVYVPATSPEGPA